MNSGVDKMTCERIPWDKRDIFHDNPADFPLEDYFPSDDMSESQEETVDLTDKNTNGQP
jgi:hypothetical protein